MRFCVPVTNLSSRSYVARLVELAGAIAVALAELVYSQPVVGDEARQPKPTPTVFGLGKSYYAYVHSVARWR